MKIICGTDFSQHADEAARVAAAIAIRLKGTVALAHVLETARYELLSKEMYEGLRSKSQEKLRTEAQGLRKTGATVEEILLEGSPAVALTELATRTQAQLVVVSSLGQIAPSRWFVGSVAERIAQVAFVPTLVVRGEEAFEAWTQGNRPLNILAGCDFSASSDAALRWVSGLHKIGPCNLTVASVCWPPQENSRFGLVEHSGVPENPPDLLKYMERDLRKHCQDIFGDGSVQIRVAVAWGRPEPQLLELAEASKADLIVVGTHQRHGLEKLWLGSISRGILHHAPMSVACVPPLAAVPGSIPVLRRVLVPTDFSDLGNAAIPVAYSLLPQGGSVCVFHARKQAGSGAKSGGPDRMLKKLEEQLRALIPAEAEARRIETKVEVVEDNRPSIAIGQAAARFGADLICMASHGRSGLSKTILGSVAETVMLHSRLPVLVVRPPSR